MKSNHHTHTIYSDGNSNPEDYVIQAIEKGFDILGFTEHSPLNFENTFSFKEANREAYINLISNLKERYAGQLMIHAGMEMDYIPGISEDFASIRESYKLDYLIGSVHLVKPANSDKLWFTDGPRHETYDDGLFNLFGGDIRKAVGTYYRQVNEMISSQEFEILGHFDKIKMHNKGRYFSEDEIWYQSLVNETIELVSQKDLVVEVNTRGIYKKRSDTTYPGREILLQLKKKGIPVMINSDAHVPNELDGEFAYAAGLLKEAGITEQCYFDGNWKFSPLS